MSRFAEGFEPVTLQDIKSAVTKVITGNGALDKWAPRLKEEPCRNTVAFVGLTSLLFFLSERGRNPKVNTIIDATLYCSTCLNVGYADIHPVTQAGKLLGTLLMTFGPGLVSRTMEGSKSAESPDLQPEILASLQRIVDLLEKQERPVT